VSGRIEMEARDRITEGVACALDTVVTGEQMWTSIRRVHSCCPRTHLSRAAARELGRSDEEGAKGRDAWNSGPARRDEIAFLGRDDDVPRPTRLPSDASSVLVRAQTRAHDGDDIDSDVSATILFLGGCSLYLRFPACSSYVPRDGYIHSQPPSSSPLKPQNSRPS
jgi:hypothetical protein